MLLFIHQSRLTNVSQHADFVRLCLQYLYNNSLKYRKLIVMLEICVGSCLKGCRPLRMWGAVEAG